MATFQACLYIVTVAKCNCKSTGNIFTQCIHEKGEGGEPLPVLMYKSQFSAVFCCYDN